MTEHTTEELTPDTSQPVTSRSGDESTVRDAMHPDRAGSDTPDAAAPRPGTLPVLPLRDTVVLPQTVLPVLVGRPRSKELIKYLVDRDQTMVALSAQRHR